MSADAVPNAVEQIPDATHPAGVGLIKPGYDPKLTNQALAPLHRQNWSSYNIFAFWMSDVHSVGGYLAAGSLFALGIAGWQVLIALLIGIVIVQVFVNLVAKPSQKTLLSLFTGIGDFGWFIGCGLGFAIFALLERTRPMITMPPAEEEGVSDGTAASTG